MTLSIYWIHHKEHTDIFSQGYVGVSKNFKRRLNDHFKRTQNKHLKYAVQKYGWNNLVKEQVLIGEKEYCLDIEKKLRPNNNIGWNITVGGGLPPVPKKGHNLGKTPWNKGKTYSAETRKKISESTRLQMQDPARKEINRQMMLGKKLRLGVKISPEGIKNMSLVRIGKPSKMKGKKHSTQAAENIRKATFNFSWTCPHCNKYGVGKGARNRWHFDNCKFKEL